MLASGAALRRRVVLVPVGLDEPHHARRAARARRRLVRKLLVRAQDQRLVPPHKLGAVDAERRLAGRRRVAVLRADGAPRQFGDDVRVVDGGHVALAHEVEHAPVPVRVEAVAVLARVRAEPDRDVVGGAQRGLLLGALAVAHAEF